MKQDRGTEELYFKIKPIPKTRQETAEPQDGARYFTKGCGMNQLSGFPLLFPLAELCSRHMSAALAN